MAYVTPTAADIKARFPEFENAPDALITAIIAESEPYVGETWLDRDRRPAVMFLVAHKLATEGRFKATASAGGAGGVTTGPMKRRKVGDVEVEYAGAGSSAGGGSGNDLTSLYGGTQYGREYLALMRRNFPAIAIV